MFAFPFILIITGLLFMFIQKRLKEKFERMDADYTGDLIKDKEYEATYLYEKRIKKDFQRGIYYFGLLLLFWGVVFFILLLF